MTLLFARKEKLLMLKFSKTFTLFNFFLLISPFTLNCAREETWKDTLKFTGKQTAALATTAALYGGTSYLFYKNFFSYFQEVQKKSRLLQINSQLPLYASCALTIPVITAIASYTAQPLWQFTSLLFTGQRHSQKHTLQALKKTYIYAQYILLLNTILNESNQLITDINSENFQTFITRPEILDSIFANLTNNSNLAELNKIIDINASHFNDIMRELYLMVDKNTIPIEELTKLQDISVVLKKKENRNTDEIITFMREMKQAGFYYILHDFYTNIKIVKTGLRQGVDVQHSATTVKNNLTLILAHWTEIVDVLHYEIENILAECRSIIAMERFITQILGRNLE